MLNFDSKYTTKKAVIDLISSVEKPDGQSELTGFGDDKIVDVNVRRIRMKIEDEPSSPKYILTIWGFGYKWSAGNS